MQVGLSNAKASVAAERWAVPAKLVFRCTRFFLERNYNSSWTLRVLGKFMRPSDLR
jgi:hypothetical protein